MLILHPWQEGPRVSLVDYLRDVHAHDAEDVLREIEKRKRDGTPLTDDTDWTSVSTMVAELAKAGDRKDPVQVREACAAILKRTADTLAPLKPFDVPEGFDDITVVLRTIPEDSRAILAAAVSRALAEFAKALEPFDAELHGAASRSLTRAWGAYVVAGVARVDGITHVVGGEEAPFPIVFDHADLDGPPGTIDMLARSGLLHVLHTAASRFQGLPAKKALRCGLSRPSTSHSSTAPSAHSTDVAPSVASVVPHLAQPVSLRISQEPFTPTTSAHAGT